MIFTCKKDIVDNLDTNMLVNVLNVHTRPLVIWLQVEYSLSKFSNTYRDYDLILLQVVKYYVCLEVC